MTRISDMTPVTITSPTGVFAPVEKTGSTTNYRVDLAAMSSVTPQMFGAVADGATDDSAAFVAAIAYLRAFALNPSAGAFYKGSPSLFVPAGHYYMGTTTLDINHTLLIEGEGDGWNGPSGGSGCTHLRWAAATDGIRIQSPTTSGNTTVDGETHDGSGGCFLRDMCLEGGYFATESEHHGLIVRNAVKAENLYIKNWPGEAVKAWAGTVSGTNYGGNVSTSLFVGVKTEGNRIGFDVRGSDSNVVTVINCEGYQNRQAGFVDDNGAGSNTYIGCHAASNGDINGATPTKCTSSSKWYAAKWGGDFTVAPSGTTADTANWIYIGAGSVDATHPAFTATPNTFRAGGDYVTLNSASAKFDNNYSEGNGFSQFSAPTGISEGTMTDDGFRGGIRRNSRSDGYQIQQSPNVALLLKHRSTQASIVGKDEADVQHSSITLGKTSGNDYRAVDITGHRFFTSPYNGSSTLRGTIDANGLFSIGGVAAALPTTGIGYATGAGGAVTQLTSKSTATPAINKVCGQITMNNAALAAGAKVSFVVTNTTVAASDTVIVSVASGGTANAYRASVTAISAGASFTVTVENITAGSLSEAPVINFAILKAVAA